MTISFCLWPDAEYFQARTILPSLLDKTLYRLAQWPRSVPFINAHQLKADQYKEKLCRLPSPLVVRANVVSFKPVKTRQLFLFTPIFWAVGCLTPYMIPLTRHCSFPFRFYFQVYVTSQTGKSTKASPVTSMVIPEVTWNDKIDIHRKHKKKCKATRFPTMLAAVLSHVLL